jgi:predicted ATPase
MQTIESPTVAGPPIRTPDQRVRVFVSSTLEELAIERVAAKDAITQLRQTPVLFELGARPYPARDLYRAYLAQSDIFVGLYGQRYGWVAPGMDISGLEDEYRLAAGKPKLIYVKTPAPDREPRLRELLGRIRDDDSVSYHKFASADELRDLVADDLALVLTERFASGTRAAPVPLTPLPVPRGALIDRERESAAAQNLLLDDDVGLVTLTGPGGVGKTRLALAVAGGLAEHFGDGVAFVALDGLVDTESIPATVARALGVPERTDRSIAESLVGYLRDKRLLLVLDNAEQLVAAAPMAAQVLEAAPQLKLLVTSREPLRVRGERVVAVAPLAVPDADPLPALDGLARIPAVALFLARAHEVRPDFALTAENAPAVAAICRRLDGLPLALELAAARLNVLTPQVLLQRLEQRLPLSTHGARDLPARQQTLRDTIAWSDNLLTDDDRRLFRHLAVFAGGFSLEEAVAVAAPSSDAGPTETAAREGDVLEGVASLVDKNLLISGGAVGGAPRFTMLATIRDYAVESLEEDGGLVAQRRRHALFFRGLAEEAEPKLHGAEQQDWLARLEADHDNLRVAMRWARESGEHELGLRLAGSLWYFWFARGYLREGRAWLQSLMAPAGKEGLSGVAAAVRAKALSGAAWLAYVQTDYERAVPLAEESLALWRELGEAVGSAAALTSLGCVALDRGDYARARPLLDESLALARAAADSWWIAVSLINLGLLAGLQGDYPRARELLEESLALERARGDARNVAYALTNLGTFAVTQGDLERAWSVLEESLPLHRDLGDTAGAVEGLEDVARIAAAQGQPRRAARLLGAAEALRDASGASRPPYLQDPVSLMTTSVRASLGDTVFAAERAKGTEFSLEQAVADVLALSAPEGETYEV